MGQVTVSLENSRQVGGVSGCQRHRMAAWGVLAGKVGA